MKNYLFIFILFLSINSFSQVKDIKEMRKICTEMLDIIKEHSIVSDSFDWNLYPQKIDSLILANNHQDSFRKIRDSIINDLKLRGDNHSSYFSHRRIKVMKKEKDSFYYPNCKILDNSIGYIEMPGTKSWNWKENKNFIETVRAQIKKIDDKYLIKGWILDLRKNHGGNYNLMILAINPLIEDGIVGYSVIKNKKIPWNAKSEVKLDNIDLDRFDHLIEYKTKTKNPRIIVLIDSPTASAAEMICISLHTVPNVKFIGNYSGGYTTDNIQYKLSNEESLNLASGYFADRSGKIHKGKLKPDIFVSNEEAIDKAKKLIIGE